MNIARTARCRQCRSLVEIFDPMCYAHGVEHSPRSDAMLPLDEWDVDYILNDVRDADESDELEKKASGKFTLTAKGTPDARRRRSSPNRFRRSVTRGKAP